MSLFFAVVFPLMFLVLFGGVFNYESQPKHPPGRGRPRRRSSTSCPPGAKAAFDQTFDVTRERRPRRGASRTVRKGDADVAVEMRGDTLVAHYTQTDQVKAAITQGTLDAFVDGANQDASGTAAAATR